MTKRPSPTGEYAVGTCTYTVYNDREEVLAPGTMRSISARLYYPVSGKSVKGMAMTRYMSRNVAKGLAKSVHAPINYDKREAAGDNVSECYTDAPVIGGVRFPLVVFSHGYFAYRESNAFLCIELASHGYVVLCIGHPLEACCTEFDDGSFIFSLKGLSNKQYEPFLGGMIHAMKLTHNKKGTERELAAQFDELQRGYCKFLMSRVPEWEKDTLSAVAYAKEHYADLIDFTPGIAVTGHSFGGATAYALCQHYPEYVCGVNLDGMLLGDYKDMIMTKPFLQICCKGNYCAETKSLIDHSAPAYLAKFEGMQHLGFTDMKHMMAIRALTGKLNADIAFENIRKLHLEFFEAYFRKSKEYPDFESNEAVTVKVYEPDVPMPSPSSSSSC